MNVIARFGAAVVVGVLFMILLAATLALMLAAASRSGDLVIATLLVVALAVGACLAVVALLRPLNEPDD